MKCNYCGTTIPEGSKICNGCGKKITIFSNTTNSTPLDNNYKIIDNYDKSNYTGEEKIEEIENLLNQSKISLNNVSLQDKNAILATTLSIIGIMFIPFGIIFNIIALNKANQITNPTEKAKTLRTVKIFLIISAIMVLLFLLPIIFAI